MEWVENSNIEREKEREIAHNHTLSGENALLKEKKSYLPHFLLACNNIAAAVVAAAAHDDDFFKAGSLHLMNFKSS